MAWTDEFTDVAWSNGDYVTELKMTQMVANDRWCRDQLSFSHLVIPAPLYVHDFIDTWNTGGWWRLQILADTTVLWTSSNFQTSTWIDVSEPNISLAGLTNGQLYDLTYKFTRSTDGSTGWSNTDFEEYSERSVKFLKTQVLEYLSHWTNVMRYRGLPDGELIIYEYMGTFDVSAVILHTESQTW